MVSMTAPDGLEVPARTLEGSPAGLPIDLSSQRWSTLLACLTLYRPQNLPPFEQAVKSALRAGATPFETMVGAPFLAYGPRLSLRAGQDPRAVAEAVGLADHPWGPPPIVGLRGQADGTVRAKGYHMLTRLDANERARGRFVPEDARVALSRRALPLPDGLPAGLEPWMVSLDGPRVELYQFLRSAAPWREFASCCTRCFPGVSLSFSPYPRPVEQGFCLSLRWEHEELMTVTLYADQRALPDDDVVRDAWSHD